MNKQPDGQPERQLNRGVEMSLAYERAADAIQTECCVETADDPLLNGWFDLDSASTDLEMEIEYLESRWLVLHHPDNPRLIAICDEAEPCGPEISLQASPALNSPKEASDAE